MKKFSFMVAFFAAIFIFNIFHKVEEPVGATQNELYAYQKVVCSSIATSLILATISSVVVYFGVSGFMTHLKKKEKE